MKAVETTGIIDKNNILKINKQLNKEFLNKSVRILILLPDEKETFNEINEELWLKSISHNLVFDFLNDPEEDIYSLTDGKPFEYEI